MKVNILILILIIFSCGKVSKMHNINIFYIPIGTETYIPVTIENIEDLAVYKTNIICDDEDISKIISYINKAKKGQFDNKYVRLKIVFPHNELLYIDNNGGLFYNNIYKSLDKNKLLFIKDFIESKLK